MMRYEYECPNGHRTECRYPMGKAPQEIDCIECGEDAKRVFTPPMIKFKGDGFHTTDYGPGAPKE